MLHMFVNDFGEEFAPMIAVDSANSVAVDDTNSLRYGMRTNGKSGFVCCKSLSEISTSRTCRY